MLPHRLRTWWRARRRPAAPRPRVILYTRRGCHLCDDAWAVLLDAQRRHPCDLEAVDIDPAPDLRAKYDHEVPVVTVNGRVHFRGRVNPVLLDRLLRAAARPPADPGSPRPVPLLLYTLLAAFVGYLLATGCVALATSLCRRILLTEFAGNADEVNRVLTAAPVTFLPLTPFVLLPYVPLAILVGYLLFRRR